MLNLKNKGLSRMVAAGITLSAIAFASTTPSFAGTLSIGKSLIPDSEQQVSSSDVWMSPPVNHVIQTGFGHETEIKSFGRNVQLSRAVRMVVPSGWTVYAAPGVNSSILVSWRGHKSWVSFVNGFMTDSGYQALVSWRDRTIQIVSQKPDHVAATVNPTTNSALATPSVAPQAVQVKPAPTIQVNPVPIAKVNQTTATVAPAVKPEAKPLPVNDNQTKPQAKEQIIY